MHCATHPRLAAFTLPGDGAACSAINCLDATTCPAAARRPCEAWVRDASRGSQVQVDHEPARLQVAMDTTLEFLRSGVQMVCRRGRLAWWFASKIDGQFEVLSIDEIAMRHKDQRRGGAQLLVGVRVDVAEQGRHLAQIGG